MIYRLGRIVTKNGKVWLVPAGYAVSIAYQVTNASAPPVKTERN